MLERLAVIDSILGIDRDANGHPPVSDGHAPHSSLDASTVGSDYVDQDSEGLWLATSRLMQYSEPHERNIWTTDVVIQLWRS